MIQVGRVLALIGALLSSIPQAAGADASFRIDPPSKRWHSVQHPMPGVVVAYFRKPKGREPATSHPRANVTVIRDRTAGVYGDLSKYMSSALDVLSEQKSQVVLSISEGRSKKTGKYFVVHSRKKDHEQVQAVYFKPGAGFYVVTATASRQDFRKFIPEFDSILKSARFQ